MGCCLGTTSAAATNHRHPDKSKLKLKHKSKPTPPSHSPPPAFEEETVKEVLSETPIVPKTLPPPIAHHPQILQSEEHSAVDLTKKPSEEAHENVSEMSEMYSYSESFSAATTATAATAADGKKDEIEMEDDGEVNQKVKIRSPPAKRVLRKRPVAASGEVAAKKERVARPAARRQMAPSPEKKRQSPARNAANVQRQRNVGQPNDGRREVTARRSRSPAVRGGEAGQRRKVRERSPAEKSRDVMPVNALENEEKSTVEKAEEGGVSPEPQATESLENPLVSLECFIFL